MNLSKLRSTTPKSRPAPVRPATPAAPAAPPAPVAPAKPAPKPVAYVPPAQAAETDEHRLRRMVAHVIGVAYSDGLPADAPGVQRTLENRRRAYVYSGVVHFVNHNVPFKDDENATLMAVAMAHTMLLDRSKGGNGTTVIPDAVPPAPVAPLGTKARAERADTTPTYDAVLVAKVHKAMDTLIAANRQFSDPHVEKNPRLKQAAVEFLDRYVPGTLKRADKFLLDVRRKLDVRPEFRVGSITKGQARAVLNCWMDGYKAAQPGS